MDFKELKILDLFSNKIVDVSVLKKMRFEKLEKLNLSSNKINKDDKDNIKDELILKINELRI